MSREFAKIREQFIEQIGLVAQGEGMPRIAGRLMGLMVFDGKPRSFGELARELNVSRGSISTNARMLEERGFIERLGIAGDRQDYFQLAENPYEMLLKNAAARARKAEALIGRTADALAAEQTDITARIDEFQNFYKTIAASIDEAANSFRK
uniref:GbsR/MarR family transcriptional regulator n=1 Tax=Pararhizobium sp. IMCC3301 TaxID=3067904 RepID=UPI002741CE58|nr:MarR family transcriptional regulator [Pararhizobium sp. IMCC3301]